MIRLAIKSVEVAKEWIVNHTEHLFFGAISFLVSAVSSICGYFQPMGEIFMVMFWTILIDMFTGVWAARAKGYGIKSKRLKKTVIKIGVYFGVVALIYAIDHAFNVVNLSVHIAWLIVGVEFYSILENAAVITDHRVFRLIKSLMKDKVKDTTGVDIDEKEEEENHK